MTFEFKVKGFKEMARQMRELADEVPDKAAAALYREGEQIVTTAKQATVPKDLGVLVNSGMTDQPELAEGGIQVSMHFGGPAAPYALAIHEHPSIHSPPTWQGKPIEEIFSVRERIPWSRTGRGPKYLERPLNDAVKGMNDRIAKAIQL